MKRWPITSFTFFAALTFGSAVALIWNQSASTDWKTHSDVVRTVVFIDEVQPSSPVIADLPALPEVDEYKEVFTDDSRIGRKKKNKVEVRCSAGKMTAEIKFYSRPTSSEQWELRQSFEFDKDTLTPCAPEIKDFNNDGFKDFTYRSNVAARGANEVRTLVVYDNKNDEFIHIKNSENYPNLKYNKRLDCVDSWMFHGSTTTIFLKIEGDELKEFASVDTGADLVATLTGDHGRKEVFRQKMREEDIYTRYATFDPPKP